MGDSGFGTSPQGNFGTKLRARQSYGADLLYGYVTLPQLLIYLRTGT